MVTAVAFAFGSGTADLQSNQSLVLASASWDRTVKLWNIDTGWAQGLLGRTRGGRDLRGSVPMVEQSRVVESIRQFDFGM